MKRDLQNMSTECENKSKSQIHLLLEETVVGIIKLQVRLGFLYNLHKCFENLNKRKDYTVDSDMPHCIRITNLYKQEMIWAHTWPFICGCMLTEVHIAYNKRLQRSFLHSGNLNVFEADTDKNCFKNSSYSLYQKVQFYP